jgi:hypothetical protein
MADNTEMKNGKRLGLTDYARKGVFGSEGSHTHHHKLALSPLSHMWPADGNGTTQTCIMRHTNA